MECWSCLNTLYHFTEKTPSPASRKAPQVTKQLMSVIRDIRPDLHLRIRIPMWRPRRRAPLPPAKALIVHQLVRAGWLLLRKLCMPLALLVALEEPETAEVEVASSGTRLNLPGALNHMVGTWKVRRNPASRSQPNPADTSWLPPFTLAASRETWR